jgi:hypothetical protein
MAIDLDIQDLGTTGAYTRMAVVAGQGFGKTVFAGTAPNALFLMSDREGAESAVSLGYGRNSKEVPIRHLDQGPHSLLNALDYMYDKGCDQFEWLVHDNATVENRLCLKRAIQRQVERPGSKMHKWQADKGQYLEAQNSFLGITEDFFDLPINQIWLVRPKLMVFDDPEKGSIDILGADIQNPQVAENFLGLFSIVGMGMVREVQKNGKPDYVRRMYFSHRDPYRGKDRTNSLGNYKDDLTVPRMMELIEAKRASRRSTTRRATKKTVATRTRRTA